MSNIYNNILSYFIKDIKDNNARSFYEQIKYENSGNIRIFHKDLLLFQITNNYCYKYIDNIITNIDSKFICNYKICCDYYDKYKYLYYKNHDINNYIMVNFTYNKYLKKLNFHYCIYLLSILKNINILGNILAIKEICIVNSFLHIY